MKISKKNRAILDRLYLSPSEPSSLGGVHRLLKHAERHGIAEDEVRNYLQRLEGYTQHKQAKRKFERRKILCVDSRDQYQIDLADMQKFSDENDNFKYLLMSVDCFSRYACSVPVKDKSAREILRGLSIIFKEYGIPIRIQSDKGKEFTSKAIKSFFKECSVIFFTTTNDDVKCAMVERLIRTIKQRLWIYMTENNTFRYIDILDDVLESYNNTVHSATGYTPNDVDENAAYIIRDKMLQSEEHQRPQLFFVGDYVRMLKRKKTFEKGYETNFTDEIFKVVSAEPKGKHFIYKLEDQAGEPVIGYFYHEELSKVIKEKRKYHKISHIIKERRYKGKKQYLIRWSGYGSAFDSWENADELE